MEKQERPCHIFDNKLDDIIAYANYLAFIDGTQSTYADMYWMLATVAVAKGLCAPVGNAFKDRGGDLPLIAAHSNQPLKDEDGTYVFKIQQLPIVFNHE
jgi:hypothetical protein